MGKKKTTEEKEYWREIWLKAIDNLPTRSYNCTTQQFVGMKDIPIGLYAALNARGNIKQNKQSLSHKMYPYIRRILVKSRHSGGMGAKHRLLFAILGDFDNYRHKRLRHALKGGIEPLEPKRRGRLLKLAESSEFAWEWLRETGTDHLYSNDVNIDSEIESVLNPKTQRKW